MLLDHLYPTIPLYAPPTCVLSPAPSLQSRFFSHFPDKITCILLFLSLLLHKPPVLKMVLFYFTGFCSYCRLRYVFISGDLEPGASDKREHGTLGLGYLTPSDLP